MVVVGAADTGNRLKFSTACGQCNGKTCLNTSSYENNLDEEIEYDSETYANFEIMVMNN